MTRPAVRLVHRDGPVTITYDRLDRPCVDAASWLSAAHGLGWCVSRDRRAQMDLLYRRGHGRLAAVLGPDAVVHDRGQRRLGLDRVADRCWEALPPGQRELLDEYAAGVDAGAPEEGPAGPWRPTASIAVAQVMLQALGSDGAELRMVEVMRRTLPPEVVDFLVGDHDPFATELDGSRPERAEAPVPWPALRALGAEPPSDEGTQPPVVADPRPAGSNAWAVSGPGRAVLANDMHMELSVPSLWYALRLTIGSTEVAGVTLPGLPMVVTGTNGAVAWGFTRLAADTADLYELEPGDSPDTYRAGSAGDLPYTRRREVIEVLGRPDVVVEVLDTHWGPVVGELHGRPVALASTLTDPAALDFTGAELLFAGTVAEAADVVNRSGLAPVNALLADRHGSIGWTVGGRFPARDPAHPRGFTAPSGAPPPRWLPAAQYPRLIDPPSGKLINCNNGNAAVVASGIAWNCFNGFRAHRVAELLSGMTTADEATAARLQLDVDASFFEFYRDLALRFLPGTVAGPLAPIRAELIAWKGTADRDEPGLALLVAFRELLREELFAALTRPCRRFDPEFTYCYHAHEGPLRRLIGGLSEGWAPAPWPGPTRLVRAQLVLAQLGLAHRSGGGSPVRWGEINRLAVLPAGAATQLTSAEPPELSGCQESVRVAQPDFGASTRLVVDPADPARGLLTIPGSPSAVRPGNDEQLARWAEGAADPLLP